jgi:predicted RNase H-like HicB family nuclease
MPRYLLNVEVEQHDEGGYLAYCDDIQGCHADGDTIAEALENLLEVARMLVELCREDDLPLPAEFDGDDRAILHTQVLVEA